jgi:hypothetical protein
LSRRNSARSSRCPKSVACIIATSGERRSPAPVGQASTPPPRARPTTDPALPVYGRPSSYRVRPMASGCRQSCPMDGPGVSS